jgi:hypothetical protein
MENITKEQLISDLKRAEDDLVYITAAQNQFMTRRKPHEFHGTASASKIFVSLDNKIVKKRAEIALLKSKIQEA